MDWVLDWGLFGMSQPSRVPPPSLCRHFFLSLLFYAELNCSQGGVSLTHLSQPKFSPCCCSNMSGFGSTELHLSLTDYGAPSCFLRTWEIKSRPEGGCFPKEMNYLNGIYFSHSLTLRHSFSFCFSGQISMRWRRRWWRLRQN